MDGLNRIACIVQKVEHLTSVMGSLVGPSSGSHFFTPVHLTGARFSKQACAECWQSEVADEIPSGHQDSA